MLMFWKPSSWMGGWWQPLWVCWWFTAIGKALLHLQLQDDTTSPQFSLTLWPRPWEAWQETGARAELGAGLSWEWSSYPCQKFLIPPSSLLPLCRAAMLLHHAAALHVILSTRFSHRALWWKLLQVLQGCEKNQLLIKNLLLIIIPL